MVVLAVTWKAHQGQEAKVAALFTTLANASRREPGCLMYVVHHHRDDPSRFLVYEQYRNDAALQAHRDSEHFQRIARGDLPRFADRLQGDLYEPLP